MFTKLFKYNVLKCDFLDTKKSHDCENLVTCTTNCTYSSDASWSSKDCKRRLYVYQTTERYAPFVGWKEDKFRLKSADELARHFLSSSSSCTAAPQVATTPVTCKENVHKDLHAGDDSLNSKYRATVALNAINNNEGMGSYFRGRWHTSSCGGQRIPCQVRTCREKKANYKKGFQSDIKSFPHLPFNSYKKCK